MLTLGRAPRVDVDALNGVNLRVDPGEIVGLLGPNGSGKTTLLRIAAGLIAPDRGDTTVCGADPGGLHAPIRARIGLVMRDDRTFHHRLNGRENLTLFARLQRLGRADGDAAIARAIQVAELEDFIDRPYRTYSAGMRARLAFARALLADPVLLLLDEATSGLDPGLRVTIRRNLRTLADDGIGVLFATHDLEEADKLCDRVVVLSDGAVAAAGAWTEVRQTAHSVFGLEDAE